MKTEKNEELEKIDVKRFNASELMHVQNIRKALKAEPNQWVDVLVGRLDGTLVVVLKKSSK